MNVERQGCPVDQDKNKSVRAVQRFRIKLRTSGLSGDSGQNEERYGCPAIWDRMKNVRAVQRFGTE
jgi:hypothetical protein